MLEGSYFGEIEVFALEAREFSVCTEVPTNLLICNSNDFLTVCKNYPKIYAETYEISR